MCRFFERQRIDEIGIYSVKLQKVLIALAIFNLLGWFSTGLLNWIGVLIEFILLYVAFYGSYKRRHRPLRAYVCINITFFVLGLIFVLLAIVFMHHKTNPDGALAPAQDLKQPPNTLMDLRPINVNTNLTDINIPTNPSTSHSGPMFLIIILAFVVSLLIFALKIASIIMAMRLARMICCDHARQLAHPRSDSSPNVAYQPMQQIQPPMQQPMQPMPPMQQPMQQPMPPMYQPMYIPMVVNGQPGQHQQYVYPNPYFIPQAMYTPQAPQNDQHSQV